MSDPLYGVIPDTFRNNAEERAHPASGILSERIQEIRKIWSASTGITNNLIIVPYNVPTALALAIYTECRISFLTGESGVAWRLGDLHGDSRACARASARTMPPFVLHSLLICCSVCLSRRLVSSELRVPVILPAKYVTWIEIPVRLTPLVSFRIRLISNLHVYHSSSLQLVHIFRSWYFWNF